MTASPHFSDAWFVQLKKADISNLDGWQQFVTDRHTYEPPPLYTRDDYGRLAPAEKRRYDLARRIANINLPKHETPMTQQVRSDLEPTLHANIFSNDPGVRAGVFISADGGLGKSTLVREIAADFDEEVRALQQLAPGLFPRNDRWVPVAWVTVPPKLAIRSLALAILDYYGAPHRTGDTDSVLTKRVEDTIRDCGSKLLVLDDITRYKDYEPDRLASDWIRNLMETSVTVVAMGVDVEGSGILYDGKTNRERQLRTQTARRFTVLPIRPFTYDTPSGIRAWVSHLRALEEDLLLLDKECGMLSDTLADYLFRQTDGVIGVLTKWVSVTAMKAVGRPEKNGGEHLKQVDFDNTPIPSVHSLKDDIDPLAPAQTKESRAPRKKGRNAMYDQPPSNSAGVA